MMAVLFEMSTEFSVVVDLPVECHHQRVIHPSATRVQSHGLSTLFAQADDGKSPMSQGGPAIVGKPGARTIGAARCHGVANRQDLVRIEAAFAASVAKHPHYTAHAAPSPACSPCPEVIVPGANRGWSEQLQVYCDQNASKFSQQPRGGGLGVHRLRKPDYSGAGSAESQVFNCPGLFHPNANVRRVLRALAQA